MGRIHTCDAAALLFVGKRTITTINMAARRAAMTKPRTSLAINSIFDCLLFGGLNIIGTE